MRKIFLLLILVIGFTGFSLAGTLSADSKARKIYNIVKRADGYSPPLLAEEKDTYIMYKAMAKHTKYKYIWLYSHEVTKNDEQVPFPVGKHLSVTVDMEGEFVKRLVGSYMAEFEFTDLRSDGKFDRLMADYVIYERKKINKNVVQELDAIYSELVNWLYAHQTHITRQ